MSAVERFIVRVEGWIDRMRSREDLYNSVKALERHNAELKAELKCLAEERIEVENELGRIRFMGPNLYKDEVDVLLALERSLNTRVATELTSDLDGDRRKLETVRRLLNRADQMPFTAGELGEQVTGIATGRIRTIPWDEIFPQVKSVNPEATGWEESDESDWIASERCEPDYEQRTTIKPAKESSDDDIPF